MTRYAIGADYSTRALHLALVSYTHVHAAKVVDLAHGLPLRETLDATADALNFLVWGAAQTVETRPVRVYLEEPWATAETGIASAVRLHRAAYHLEAVAAQVGLEVVWVAVSTWHSQVLGTLVDTKRAVKAYVKAVFGIETPDDNLADAVALGAYGVSMESIREKTPL